MRRVIALVIVLVIGTTVVTAQDGTSTPTNLERVAQTATAFADGEMATEFAPTLIPTQTAPTQLPTQMLSPTPTVTVTSDSATFREALPTTTPSVRESVAQTATAFAAPDDQMEIAAPTLSPLGISGELIDGVPVSGSLTLLQPTVSYSLIADAGSQWTIRVNDADIDTYLELYDPSGNLLRENDDGDDGSEGRNPEILYTFRETGVYTVLVTSYVYTTYENAAQEGTYTLTATFEGLAEMGFASTQALTLDTPVSGQLDGFNPEALFTVELAVGDTVSISATSDELDTYLEILDPRGAVVISDDDSGGSLNAQIDNFTAAESGVYTVLVTTFGYRNFNNASPGTFTVLVSGTAVSEVPGVLVPEGATQPLTVGEPITGTLDQANPEARYTINLEAGSILSVDVESNDMDTYIEVITPTGEVGAFDDDSGSDFNPLIEGYTATDGGTHTVIVTTYGWRTFGSSSFGNFVLTAEVTGGGFNTDATGTTLTVGETVGGMITVEQPTADFAIQLEVGQMITIDLESSAFDTYLQLSDPSGQIILEDDDSGAGTDSRLTGVRITENGTYTITVTTYGYTINNTQQQEGDFRLTVARFEEQQLAMGETLNAALMNNQNRYTFEGKAGDEIVIIASSEAFRPFITLMLGPTEEGFGDAAYGNIAVIGPIELEFDGAYSVIVESLDFGGGDFSLSLLADVAQPLTFDEPAAVTASVEQPVGVLTFTADSNSETVEFTFEGDYSTFTYSLRDGTSYEINGGRVSANPFVVQQNLFDAGDYTLLVQPESGETVSVTLRQQVLPSLDDTPITLEFDGVTFSQRAVFSGSAGERVRLTLTTSGENDLIDYTASLYQDGLTIASLTAFNGDPLIAEVIIPEDGEILVEVFNYTDSENLTLNVERLPNAE